MKNKNRGLLVLSLVVIGCVQMVYASKKPTKAEILKQQQATAAKAAADRKAAAEKLETDIKNMLQAPVATYKTYLDTTFAALDSELTKLIAATGKDRNGAKKDLVAQTVDTAQKMTASGTDHLLKQDMYKDFKFFVEEWGNKP
ncbi:MAG: hypothetical protein NT124_01810 [Candidatus Dependentiae bacterium]|nr:hypothetical protein [Candidatus Dependentiae bacterium]